MRHKVKQVHFVRIGGTDVSGEQGPRAFRECDPPRAASVAGSMALIVKGPQR